MVTYVLFRRIRDKDSLATKREVNENDIGSMRAIVIVVPAWYKEVSETYKNDS
jgi:hypothetical protein